MEVRVFGSVGVVDADLAQDVAERLGAQPLPAAIEAARHDSAMVPTPPDKG